MLSIEPTGAVLGATVRGIDVKQADETEFARILLALGQYGVLRFPDQQLDLGDLRAFSERFGEIQGPSSATGQLRACRHVVEPEGGRQVHRLA